MDDVRLCQGISEICDSYSAYIIDQWGVLHDGKKPYEGVIDALTQLRQRGKQIVVVSNSGSRASVSEKRLADMGFAPELFDHVVTSGEMAYQGLKTRDSGIFEDLGDRCYLISRGGNTSLIEGSGLTVTDNIDDADFILLSGVDDPPNGKTVVDYEPMLRAAVKRRLKMICANPDIQALLGANTHAGAGAIAARYEEFGGIVRYIGKPFPPIIRYAQSLFKDVLPSTTVVIGDSIPQDILGGVNCGLDTCMTATGIHAAAFRGAKSRADVAKIIRVLGGNFGARPNFWVPRLHWGKVLPDRKNKRRKK